MTDLVQRLRALPDTRPEPEPFEVWRDACGLALEAADEIERLRAENDALQMALEASCDRVIYQAPPGMMFVPKETP